MSEQLENVSSSENELNRAIALHRDNKLQDAAGIYQQILAQEPDNERAWFGLGSISAQQGQYHTAILQLERAMGLSGPKAEMQHNIAGAKAGLGRFAEAEAHFREALRLRPNYPEAYYNLCQLKLENEKPQLVSKMQSLLQQNALSAQDRCFLNFAAGKLSDELGEYETAIQHYEAGNRAKGKQFDKESYEFWRQSLCDVFTTERISQLAASGNRDERFVFIVGMPRSGTSLVEQILSAHPQVHACGELGDINAISQAIGSHCEKPMPYPASINSIDGAVISGFAQAYAQHVGAKAPHAKRITDKMPLNFRHLGLISALLPNARIIHCERDPIDTCLSCFFQNFRSNHDYAFAMEDLGTFYGGYRKIMAHWQSVLPKPVLTVRYEALVDALEVQAGRLIDFLDLPWDDACLRFKDVHRPVQTASRWQVRQDIYTSSKQRWRHYEKWIQALIDSLIQAGVELDT